MLNFPSHEEVEALRRKYPKGTRIELIAMEDPYAPVQPGTIGEVTGIDDAGQMHMLWSNGRTLALIPGEDSFRVIRGE